jgi:hypothetical protein
MSGTVTSRRLISCAAAIVVAPSFVGLTSLPAASTAKSMATVTWHREKVFASPSETELSSVSVAKSGRWVAFLERIDGGPLFVGLYDSLNHTSTSISPRVPGTAGDSLHGETVSGNGRVVAYDSNDATIVTPDANRSWDLFRYDKVTGVTTLVTRTQAGSPAPRPTSGNAVARSDLSTDGRLLAYSTKAPQISPGDTNNSSDVYVFDAASGLNRLVSYLPGTGKASGGVVGSPAISDDGRFIVFSTIARLKPADTDIRADIYAYNVASGKAHLVTHQRRGSFYSPAVAVAGEAVVYQELVSNGFVDLWRAVSPTRASRRVVIGIRGFDTARNGPLTSPQVSKSGRFIAFTQRSNCGTAVRGMVMRHDVATGDTSRVASPCVAEAPMAISRSGSNVVTFGRPGVLRWAAHR